MRVQAVSIQKVVKSPLAHRMALVPSEYSHLPTIRVTYVGIMHMALEVYRLRDGQPRGNRASRCGTTGETEEALVWSLFGSSTKKRS